MGLHPVTNIFIVDIPREEREKGQETYFKKFPEGRFKGEGTYVYLWLDHVDVWLRPMQCWKATILQRKKMHFEKRLQRPPHLSLRAQWSLPSIHGEGSL